MSARMFVVGVGNLLWGADYPHVEGTWPSTRLAMRNTFASVPEDERVAERKAWNCMQRRALTSSSESRGFTTPAADPTSAPGGPSTPRPGYTRQGNDRADP